MPKTAQETRKHPEEGGPRQSCGEGLPDPLILEHMDKALGSFNPEFTNLVLEGGVTRGDINGIQPQHVCLAHVVLLRRIFSFHIDFVANIVK